MLSMNPNEKTIVTKGNPNIFADLGFENPELEELKAGLVQRIAAIIRNRRLTQVQAAEILGIDQPKVSALLHGRFGGYSTDRLIRFLAALDHDVELVIRKKQNRARHRGSIRVVDE